LRRKRKRDLWKGTGQPLRRLRGKGEKGEKALLNQGGNGKTKGNRLSEKRIPPVEKKKKGEEKTFLNSWSNMGKKRKPGVALEKKKTLAPSPQSATKRKEGGGRRLSRDRPEEKKKKKKPTSEAEKGKKGPNHFIHQGKKKKKKGRDEHSSPPCLLQKKKKKEGGLK